MNLFELFVKIGVDDQASQKLADISGKLGNGLKTAAKIGTAAVGAAAAGITALTTAAVKNYAEYEQLIGGAELMFGEAFKSVQKNAKQAYKTVQMSQSEYLQQVNGFATGLKTALNGNEKAAADLAHKIIEAEADIVAATGNTQENVANAFNGIMKSNFTMLDNLQLGITPTKEGFQEVIDKVNEWNKANGKATKYQMGNLADMQSALVDYVKMQGLSGYASDEAAKTISGSVASMKAAWTNLVTGLADKNADIEALMNNLVTTIVGDGTKENLGVLGNIMPAVETALNGASTLISTAVPKIVELIPQFIKDIIPKAVSAVKNIISSIAGELPSIIRAISDIVPDVISAIEELIPEIISAIGEIFPEIIALIEDVFPDIVNLVLENLPSLLQTIFEAIPGIIESLGSIISEIVPTLVQTIVQVVQLVADNIGAIIDAIIAVIPVITESVNNAILENFPSLLQAIIQLVLNIIDKLPEIIQMMVDQIGPIVSTIVQVIVENLPAFIEGIVKIIWGIIKALPSIIVSLAQAVWEAFKGIGVGIINAWPKFKEGIVSLWNKVTDWFAGIWNKTKEIGGNIISGIKEGIKNAWNNLVSWFKGLFNDLIGIAKKILGIASPSKVFKKLGSFTAQGFGIGFDDEFARVKGDMEDALAFDDASIGINASMYKNGAGAISGLQGGTSIGSVSINIDGARYDDEQSLAEAVAEAIQNLTDRRSAVYA